MRKKLQSTTSKLWAAAALAVILIIWQFVSMAGLVPGYMLPSPIQVVKAFISEFPLLMENSRVTLLEAAAGLFCGVAFGFVMAVLMGRYDKLYKAFYPLIVITQTVPTVAIAPLLVVRIRDDAQGHSDRDRDFFPYHHRTSGRLSLRG